MKTFEIETTEDVEKQIKALKTLNTDQQLKSMSDLFSKYFLRAEAKDESEKIKRQKKKSI